MRYFLDRRLTVRRLRVKSNTSHSAFSATGTGYDCGFQDPTPDRLQLYNGLIGKQYDIFVSDSNANIKAGDEVVIGSHRYSIRAKETVDFGASPFITLIGVLEE
jgi:hypothetical protein